MTLDDKLEIEIRGLQNAAEIEKCARMMADSEPWITLRRTYEDALKMLDDSSKEIYAATRDNAPVGFIIFNMRGAFVGYIQTVCVAAEWRGKMVGSRLINFAERKIFSETPNVFLCVSSFNKEAQKLYERLGYKIVGELKDYIIAGQAEILLRKTIAPIANFKKQQF